MTMNIPAQDMAAKGFKPKGIPTKVKIVSTEHSMLKVRFLSTEKQVEMNPNDLVRRVEEGALELVD
ncbi:MAG: hypothetical protein H6577_02230 [Lewinellaceae bacterium]|nr:hypothetical protein [Saprospiraceae bacterium]MCB9336926.1 hypothetical protein [Lewinellaceae bacterium]